MMGDGVCMGDNIQGMVEIKASEITPSLCLI